MERNEAKKQMILIPAEEIGNNIDLLTEILLRLQVKPLLTFKCVSKQWLSLISDPQFCLSHNRHHHHTPYPTPTALLLDDFKTVDEFQLKIVPLKHQTIPKVLFFDYLKTPKWVCIDQSCNGLLLCSSKSYTTPTYSAEHGILPECIYHIWNPTTKHFKTLSFPSREFKDSLVSVNLAFDPLKSSHYKLICVRKEKNMDKCQIYIYSSETDSWRPLDITFTQPNFMAFAFVAFCNGVVYWYGSKISLYFDVDRECFNTMSMTNCPMGVFEYFGESRGHLHLILSEHSFKSPLQFDVLEMAPDYSGWFVRYHVNLDAIKIAFPDIVWDWDHEGYGTFSVLNVIRAQKEEESILVVFVDNRTISYNFHDGTLKKLCDLEPEGFSYSSYNTFQYFEILTSGK